MTLPTLYASTVILAFGLSIGSAAGQSGDGQDAQGNGTHELSEAAQPLAEESAAGANADLDDPIVSDRVDVSLGDWDVKTQISKDLSVPISEVPLTVAVASSLAGEVCPIRGTDLQQQQTVSAVRTCAAKSVNPKLLEAVKTKMSEKQTGNAAAGDPIGGAGDGSPGTGTSGMSEDGPLSTGTN